MQVVGRGVEAGQVPAEVRGLHRAGAAARGDHVVGAQPQPEAGRVQEARGAPLQRVAAHHAHQPPARHPVGQGHVHGVVVQRLRHRRVAVVGGLGPGVRAGVERVGVRGGVVEVLGPVEVVEVEVDRSDGEVGHDDRAPGLDALGLAGREAAAEEQRPRHPQVAQLGRPVAQVHGADPPAAQRRGPGGEAVVEVGQGVDLDPTAPTAPHVPEPRARCVISRSPQEHVARKGHFRAEWAMSAALAVGHPVDSSPEQTYAPTH